MRDEGVFLHFEKNNIKKKSVYLHFQSLSLMPLDRNKILRYQVLDRCFRDISRLFNVSQLQESCNVEMRRYDYKCVSIRTIQNDIKTLRNEPFNVEFDEGLLEKHYYRYADTSQHLKILKLIDPNHDALHQTIELLQDRYCNPDNPNPQWQWLLLALQSLVGNKPLEIDNPYVSFENNEAFAGNIHFSLILGCIINHQPIVIRYQPFKKTHPDEVKIYPYYLKQYHSRWFLVARVDDVNEIITFALDRIHDISIWKHDFIPSDVDFNDYYKDVTGVTVLSDEHVSTVVLRVTAQRYPYIQTKPFSEKQKVVSRDGDHFVITFPMRINNEFRAKILSYGSDVEVLKPKRLRDEIMKIVKDTLQKYN